MTLHSDQDSAPFAQELPARIPPGEYDAVCYDTEIGRSWGNREDIYIKFRIIDGPYVGTELVLICTYHRKSEISHRHKYYKQFCLAFGSAPQRGQRLSRSIFKNKSYSVLVRDTERKFRNKRLMPSYLQYSVVDTILETLTGIPMK